MVIKPCVLLSILLCSHTLNAADSNTKTPSTLPEPLSLAFALQRAALTHPKIEQAQAIEAQAQAQLRAEKTKNKLDVSLYGRLSWGKPSKTIPYLGHQDHRASLRIRSRLYDFGQKKALVAAASEQLKAENSAVLAIRWQQKLTAAQAFFDVLLADLQTQVDTEAVAIAFIRFDRIKDRQRVGQKSDIDSAKAENTYQEIVQIRRKSELQQRLSRARLASTLNSLDLPNQLKTPILKDNQRLLPELDTLTELVLKHNPQRQILMQRLQAAKAQLRAERAERLPKLHGQLETNYWQRTLSSRDNTRAMLELEVPLYSSGYRSANIAEAKAASYEIQAALADLELSLRQTVLEIWADLQNLAAQRTLAKARLRWREMEMDKHRTLYDLEFSTDFGMGLVELSRSNLLSAETEYAIAMQWLHLRALSDDHLPQESGS